RTIEGILSQVLVNGQGRCSMKHEQPVDQKALYVKPDLSRQDTRPGTKAVAAVCACGDELGAAYYACSHNLSPDNDTPILIEFEAPQSAAAVDGKDFLYTTFQLGDPERARHVLERSFGKAVLRYADRAWSSEDQSFRMAQCDLAIHDPEVVEAHHSNDVVLAGRYKTIFQSAFTVELPIQPETIINVWSPSYTPAMPAPGVRLDDILRKVQ
ncbi:MAG: hypothetical protein LPK86_12480, partial [Alphaproteobacteria bacterium]|nr:hypothetical protein [Alphaproteobacteria bacterium]